MDNADLTTFFMDIYEALSAIPDETGYTTTLQDIRNFAHIKVQINRYFAKRGLYISMQNGKPSLSLLRDAQ